VYRFLYVLGLLAWGALTFLLNTYSESTQNVLVTVRVSSNEALIWLLSGTGLLLAGVLRILRARRVNLAWVMQFKALSASLDEGIIVCDRRGKPRWNNATAQSFVQIGAKDIIPNLIKQQRQAPGQLIRQTVNLSESERYAVQVLPLDRQTYAVVYRPLNVGGEKNIFYENFIRRIVHDLRNPLAAIIGHAANLSQAPTVEPEAWRKSIQTIESEAQRLTRLVDSMLFDARLAYVPLQPQMIDFADVLEEALYTHEDRAAREGKNLSLNVPSDPVSVEGDRDLLLRAFENLIDNSLKYSRDGSAITVRLTDAQTYYVVTVQDNGDGISPDYLPDRIFEPLVRARQTGSGSGLGLSIVRKIIEMHGGSISAQSRLGAGTIMTVRLNKPQQKG